MIRCNVFPDYVSDFIHNVVINTDNIVQVIRIRMSYGRTNRVRSPILAARLSSPSTNLNRLAAVSRCSDYALPIAHTEYLITQHNLLQIIALPISNGNYFIKYHV